MVHGQRMWLQKIEGQKSFQKIILEKSQRSNVGITGSESRGFVRVRPG